MDSPVGETASCSTTFIPRWDATLVWDVAEEALCSLGGATPRTVSSCVTKMEQKALGKSLAWRLSLSKDDRSKEKADFALYLTGDSVEKVWYCTYEVFLQRAGDERRKCLTGVSQKVKPQHSELHKNYARPPSSYRQYTCSFPLDLVFSDGNRRATDGASRFYVKLKITFENESRAGPRVLLPAEKSIPSTNAWIASLFNNNLFSDVTIECGGKSFFAHKNVLGQSLVFAIMFSIRLSEAHSNKLTISDTDPTTFEYFLKSLYGVPYELPLAAVEEILELINLAEKYGITDIKVACFRKLAGMISDENAAKVNIAAYRFCNGAGMKEFRDFFKSYCQERHNILVKNPDYCRLFKENFDAFI